ncbi:CHAT domain-containing protein [Streptomyces sp. NEAU-YJ-81]|uniref:CHAT domain-containing protein n=1 Tax=Streptomyces sp. NEAU-YJ-81 TaxID=2820288 RepID=UPI001ABC565D|nr:CHAT domain-containing protein [Streptomyces sp. NEAU-YJ-81]MBO3675718.1 CHAT domain-containing protein [Streptomyces sp. NEAU-YJ-81]
MTDGGGHSTGDGAPDALMERAVAAVREARELLNGDDIDGLLRSAALRRVMDRLTDIEGLLPADHPARTFVVPQLGALIGLRCTHDGDADPGERETALRHLRWADRALPVDHLPAVESRTVLVGLLLGGAVAVAPEPPRADLTEAREIVERLARAPMNPDFHETTAAVRRRIDRSLARPPADPVADAVHGLVSLASSLSTARFTRLLVWLFAELYGSQPEQDIGVGLTEMQLDPVGIRLLGALARAVGPGAGTPAARARGVRRAGELAQQALSELPPNTLERAHVAKLHAYLLLVTDLLAPGSVDFDELDPAALEPECADRAQWPVALDLDPGLVPHLDDWTRDFSAELGLRERTMAANLDRLLAYRSGDPGHLERAAALLRDSIGSAPEDHPLATTARATLSEVLAQSAADGNHQDAEAALAIARELRAAAVRDGSAPDASEGSNASDASDSAVGLTLSWAGLELGRMRTNGDPTGLPELIEELTGRYEALPPDSAERGKLASTLAEAYRIRVRHWPDPAGERLAAHYLGEAERAGERSLEPTLFTIHKGSPIEGRAALDRALADADAELRRTLEEPRVNHDQEYLARGRLGLLLLMGFQRFGEPALLDRAIAELTPVRRLISGGHASVHRGDTLEKLSEAHLWRSRRDGPHRAADLRATLDITHQALTELAADVLLQLGAEHGLAVARDGAVLSRRLAFGAIWLSARPDEAVRALELGRAMVLRAAAASRGIPDLLAADGHLELARRWRAQTAATASPEAAGPRMTGALRRMALNALGAQGDSAGVEAVLGVPEVAELAAGLAATRTDALVYLVPGQGLRYPAPGFALIVRSDSAQPHVLPLPQLLGTGSAPLDRYLKAAADRSGAAVDPARYPSLQTERHWQTALADLCDWAWEAAIGPLLDALGLSGGDALRLSGGNASGRSGADALGPSGGDTLGPSGGDTLGPLGGDAPGLSEGDASPSGSNAPGPALRPPRIVLVPCGPLGAVVWHAARRPRAAGEPGHRFACQDAVFSYAPSGAQFLRAAGRRRLPATGRQVLVADPDLTLLWAEAETDALRTACYPDALRYGAFLASDEPEDAPGTPDDLLAVLPGGNIPASVLHISCHAVAGPHPTRSALRLAAGPDAEPNAGLLTVARLLDGAADRPPDTAGPLIVLSACETDLSTRDHDESLTLATALVARGAADAVGSRWAVRDSQTAVMMAVFHHFLTAEGLAPPDALRATQLWMLDPDRTPPPTLRGELLYEATGPDLDRIHHWAAFTHQGNPAPGVA